MAFTDYLFQRGPTPVLEAGLGFSHQRALVIGNNIANVETPQYKRQTVPEDEFSRTLLSAIARRNEQDPAQFTMEDGLDIKWNGTYPGMPAFDGKENGLERHDENSVVLEREIGDLAKNESKTMAMQQLFRKSVAGIHEAARDAR